MSSNPQGIIIDFKLLIAPPNGSTPEGTEVIWSIYKVSMAVPENTEPPNLITFGKCTIRRLEH